MRFDPVKREYVDDRGRVISARQVRKEVEKYVEQEEEDAEAEAAKLVAGLISATAFFLYMTQKVEAWHKVAGAIAYGGRAQMDAERWDRINGTIQSELKYLEGFREEVAKATELTDEVVNRAGMYANAAYSTFENNVRERESDSGVTLGRRVCEEDGTSCEECVGAADTYFRPLDEIEDIGSLQCLNNCRCFIEYAEPPLEATLVLDNQAGEGLPA